MKRHFFLFFLLLTVFLILSLFRASGVSAAVAACTSPVNGSMVNPNNVTFTWTGIPGAPGYHFRLALREGDWPEIIIRNDIPGTSFTGSEGRNAGADLGSPINLTAGKSYHWRVWPSNDSEATAGSACDFTVAAPPAIPDSPTSLNASCSAPGTHANFIWSGNKFATSYYELFIDNKANPWGNYSAGNDSANKIDPSDTSFSSDTSPGATYGWWMRACNSSGCSSESYGSAFTCGAAVSSWIPPTCTNGVFSGCTLTGEPVCNNYGDPGKGIGTKELWGKCNTICNSSNKNSFCSGNSLVDPSKLSPPTNPSASCPAPGTTANFSWTGVSGAGGYTVYAFDNAQRIDWSVPCGSGGRDVCTRVTGTSASASGLRPGVEYQWFVFACSGDTNNCSDPATASFTCAAPVTVASVTFNNQSLDLNGGILSTRLALPSGATSVDVPVEVTDSAGSTRRLIIKFNYLSPPTNPAASCPAPGTTANFSWIGVSGAGGYTVYAFDTTVSPTIEWKPKTADYPQGVDCGSGNRTECKRVTGTSTSSSRFTAGHTYQWYVFACSGDTNNCSDPASYFTTFTCTASSATPPPPRPIPGDADDNSCVSNVDLAQWTKEVKGDCHRCSAWTPGTTPPTRKFAEDYSIWYDAFKVAKTLCGPAPAANCTTNVCQ